MISTTLSLSALLSASTPQPCVPDSAGRQALGRAEAVIRQAEKEWAASIATNEAAVLERYAAPGFVAVFDGETLTRATLVASARKRQPGTASVVLGAFRVHLAGSTAIAEGSELWSSAQGKRRRIIWSDLWVRCGGTWRLLTSISAGSPAPTVNLPRRNLGKRSQYV